MDLSRLKAVCVLAAGLGFSKMIVAQAQVPESSALDAYARGNQFYSDEKWSDAFFHYNSAATKNPALWQAWQAMGSCQEQMGEVEAARRSYSKALEIQPDNPGLRSHLAALESLRAQAVAIPDVSITDSEKRKPALVLAPVFLGPSIQQMPMLGSGFQPELWEAIQNLDRFRLSKVSLMSARFDTLEAARTLIGEKARALGATMFLWTYINRAYSKRVSERNPTTGVKTARIVGTVELSATLYDAITGKALFEKHYKESASEVESVDLVPVHQSTEEAVTRAFFDGLTSRSKEQDPEPIFKAGGKVARKISEDLWTWVPVECQVLTLGDSGKRLVTLDAGFNHGLRDKMKFSASGEIGVGAPSWGGFKILEIDEDSCLIRCDDELFLRLRPGSRLFLWKES